MGLLTLKISAFIGYCKWYCFSWSCQPNPCDITWGYTLYQEQHPTCDMMKTDASNEVKLAGSCQSFGVSWQQRFLHEWNFKEKVLFVIIKILNILPVLLFKLFETYFAETQTKMTSWKKLAIEFQTSSPLYSPKLPRNWYQRTCFNSYTPSLQDYKNTSKLWLSTFTSSMDV